MIRLTSRCPGALLAFGMLASFGSLSSVDAQAQDGAAPLVLVASMDAPEPLRPLVTGSAEWLRDRLTHAGASVVDGGMLRRARAKNRGAPASEAELLDFAKRAGAEQLVLVELGFEDDRIEVALRVHEAGRGTLSTAGRAAATADELGRAAEAAVQPVLSSLGLDGAAAEGAPELAVENVAAHGRALAALDRGELARAWYELADDRSARGDALRARVRAGVSGSGISITERARLLALAGEGDAAWHEIRSLASAALYGATPDHEMLVAAGDVQLARGRVIDARAYYERALEIRPKDRDASFGMARVLVEQDDRAGALEHMREVVASEGVALADLEALAELEEGEARSASFAKAARWAARDLSPDRALRDYERAREAAPGQGAALAEESALARARFGRHGSAVESYRAAIAEGGATASRERGLAEALAAVGQTEEAVEAYNRALGLDPADADAHISLGLLYADLDRAEEAERSLSRGVGLAPDDARAKRGLARVVRRQGRSAEALELLEAAESQGGANALGLREKAAVQRELGDLAGAHDSLRRAVELEPGRGELHAELAELQGALGDAAGAKHSRSVAERLGTTQVIEHSEPAPSPSRSTVAAGEGRFRNLMLGFPAPRGAYRNAVLLGLREQRSWLGQTARFLAPKTIDKKALANELLFDIGEFYALVPNVRLDAHLSAVAKPLFDFGSDASLDAVAVAELNTALESDYLFVASMVREVNGDCGFGEFYRVELRRLSGETPNAVRILANTNCVAGGVGTDGVWNEQAAYTYGALLLLVLLPMIRGFGRIVVKVKLPDDSKAMCSIGVTRSSVEVESKGATNAGSNQKFRKRLGNRRIFEKKLRPGRDTVFRWKVARKAPYYVTLRGPVYHALTEQLVGDFLEEEKVRVQRGATRVVTFDLCPKQCAVEVAVFRGSEPINRAAVLVRGSDAPIRYTADGTCFLYLDKGQHTIVVGAGDRVAERELNIQSFEPQPLSVDLAHPEGLLFKGCSGAVNHYLEGRFDEAARALETAGDEAAAHRVRGAKLMAAGRLQEAAFEFEAAGDLDQATQLRSADPDMEASAVRLEQAGEHAKAAEVWKRAGEVGRAAAAYELAGDSRNAIACYHKMGDIEKTISLLEEAGRHFEAGRVAFEDGQRDRALYNLDQVEATDRRYADACGMMGGLLMDVGRSDDAMLRFDEVLRTGGAEALPTEWMEKIAQHLERSGRVDDALAVYGALRDQDLNYEGVNTRIESLQKQQEGGAATGGRSPADSGAATAAVADAPASAPSAPAVQESRYEIIEELGRGAMGVVYKAVDRHLGRTVALKQLIESLREHPNAVKFFEREARSAAVLNHPNIVTVYDAGNENGSYFISMEFLEGTPFDAIVKNRGPLDPAIVASLGVQVAAGLQYAHRNRIIHRDIKTGNLFLTRDRVVKIMDFGLAKMVEEVRRSSTLIGGTPYYMPPEQAIGEGVDHRADLYAFGVTLFQLLSASYPFSKGDVTYHHCHTPAPDVREFIATAPAEMAELILKLMEKKPDDRIQTAEEVGTILQGVLDSLRAKA